MDDKIPTVKKLGEKGKIKLFNGIKNYVESNIDYKLGKLSKEQFDEAAEKLKLMIDSLEWKVE